MNKITARRRKLLRPETDFAAGPGAASSFDGDNSCSAAELAQSLKSSSSPEAWLAAALDEARRRETSSSAGPAEEMFSFARIIHSLGSAILSGPELTLG